MSDYPLPRYAATAWVTGETLWLAFPPLGPGEKGHSVPFSINLPAMRGLAKRKEFRGIIMALEALAARHAESSIGTKGSPVGYDIERALANDKRYKEWMNRLEMTKEQVAEGDRELKELGL